MNTRKTIGTSMIALLVVALSVGMAAAGTGLSVDSVTFAFSDGDVEADAFTVKWTDDENSATINAGWTIQKKVNGAWVSTDDVQISRAGDDDFAGTDPHEFTHGTSYSYDVRDVGGYNSKVDDLYRIRFSNTDGDHYDEGDFTVTAKGTVTVPEFATLAIPVVALLGLVFFMRRKEQK